MAIIYRLFPLFLAGAAFAAPADSRKTEKQLETAYEACHHWGGEGTYNAERHKQVEAGIKKDCGDALKEADKAAAVKKKSAKVAGLILRIIDTAPLEAAAADTWKARATELCAEAEPYFAALKPADDPDAQSTVISRCPDLAVKLYKGKPAAPGPDIQ